jgi:uncharacterized membrane protein YfhO
MSEAAYPGWRATLDGKPVELARVDHACRGLWIEPGDHILECAYRPGSLYAGMALSAVAVALALVFGTRRARGQPVS